MAFKFVFLFFAVGLVGSALGYSSGAPTDACHDMVPQHETDPQTSPAPYYIKLSRNTIRSGDDVEVTITGKTAADKIRGFMVQARQTNKHVGSFVVDPKDTFVQELDCGNEPAVSISIGNCSNAIMISFGKGKILFLSCVSF